MNNKRFTYRLCALLLSFGFSAPSPAFALRPQRAGLEEIESRLTGLKEGAFPAGLQRAADPLGALTEEKKRELGHFCAVRPRSTALLAAWLGLERMRRAGNLIPRERRGVYAGELFDAMGRFFPAGRWKKSGDRRRLAGGQKYGEYRVFNMARFRLRRWLRGSGFEEWLKTERKKGVRLGDEAARFLQVEISRAQEDLRNLPGFSIEMPPPVAPAAPWFEQLEALPEGTRASWLGVVSGLTVTQRSALEYALAYQQSEDLGRYPTPTELGIGLGWIKGKDGYTRQEGSVVYRQLRGSFGPVEAPGLVLPRPDHRFAKELSQLRRPLAAVKGVREKLEAFLRTTGLEERKFTGTIRSRQKIRDMTQREQLAAFQEGRIIQAGRLDPRLQAILLRTLAGEVFGDHDKVGQLQRPHFFRPVTALNGRKLGSLWIYYNRWRRDELSPLSATEFMLEKLGLKSRASWSDSEWIDFIGKKQVTDWSKVPVQAQRLVIYLLADHLQIPVAWLSSSDFQGAIPALGGRNLAALYVHYQKLKAQLESGRPDLKAISVVEFMQLRLELPTFRDLKVPEQIAAFKEGRVSDWERVSAQTKLRLLHSVRAELEKAGQWKGRLTRDNFRWSIASLGGKQLGGFYNYYHNLKRAEGVEKPTVDFLQERIEWERLHQARLKRQLKYAVRLGRPPKHGGPDFSPFAYGAEQRHRFWVLKDRIAQGYDAAPLLDTLIEPKLGIIDLVVTPYRQRMSAAEHEQFVSIGRQILRQELAAWNPNKGALDQYLYIKILDGFQSFMPTVTVKPPPFKLGEFAWKRSTLKLFYQVQAFGPSQTSSFLQDQLIQALWHDNQGLIRMRMSQAAHKFTQEDYFEFESSLRLAIWLTVANYDPEKGAFSTSLDWNIRGAFSRAARSYWAETGLYIPEAVRQKIEGILEARSLLQAQTGRVPSDEEVASAMRDEVTADEVRWYLDLDEQQATTSLDDHAEEARPWDEVIADSDVDISEQVADRLLHETIRRVVERQGLKFLELFYFEGRRYAEIGRRMGISQTAATHHVKADIVRLLQDPEFKKAAAHLASEADIADRIQELLGMPAEVRRDDQGPQEPKTFSLDDQEQETSGLEEGKPNVNWASEERIAEYLAGLHFEFSIGQAEQMASAILKERRRGKFKSEEVFKKRMYGKVSGVKNPVWDLVASKFHYGVARMPRRMAISLGAGGTVAAVVGRQWYQSAHPPLGRVVWLLDYHSDRQNEKVIQFLEGLSKEYKDIHLVVEHFPADLEDLEQVHPGLRALIRGPEALEERRVEDELSKAARAFQELPGEQLRRMEEEGIRIGGELLRYAADHRHVHLVSEESPPDAVKAILRSHFLKDLALKALYEERKEDDFYNLMIRYFIELERSSERRDEELAKKIQGLVDSRPGDAIVISRGAGHAAIVKRVDHRRLKKDIPPLSAAMASPDRRALAPYREKLLQGAPYPKSPKIRRGFLTLFPWNAVGSALLSQGMSSQKSRESAYKILDSLTDKEMDQLTGGLQAHAELFSHGGGQDNVATWFEHFGMFTIAWLKDHDRLPPDLEKDLPVSWRGLTIPQVVETLRRTGLEEPPQLSTAQEVAAYLKEAFGVETRFDDEGFYVRQPLPETDWTMNEIRPVEKSHIFERWEDVPKRKLVYPLEILPQFSESSLHAKGVYLGFVEGMGHPVVIKTLRLAHEHLPSLALDHEFVKAQVFDRLGVAPRFYGVVDSQGTMGYVMQPVPGITEELPSGSQFVEISRRCRYQAGLSQATFIQTPSKHLVTIDAGNASRRDWATYREFIRSCNQPEPAGLEEVRRGYDSPTLRDSVEFEEAVRNAVPLLEDLWERHRPWSMTLFFEKDGELFLHSYAYAFQGSGALTTAFQEGAFSLWDTLDQARLKFRIILESDLGEIREVLSDKGTDVPDQGFNIRIVAYQAGLEERRPRNNEATVGAGPESVRAPEQSESVADRVRRDVAEDFEDPARLKEVRFTYDVVRSPKEPWKSENRIEVRQLLVRGPGGQVYLHLHPQLPYSSERSWLDNGVLVSVEIEGNQILFGDILAEPLHGTMAIPNFFVPLKGLVPDESVHRLREGLEKTDEWTLRVKEWPLGLDMDELKKAIGNRDCACVLGGSVTEGEKGLFVMETRDRWDPDGFYTHYNTGIAFKRLDRFDRMPDLEKLSISIGEEAVSLLHRWIIYHVNTKPSLFPKFHIVGEQVLKEEPRIIELLSAMPVHIDREARQKRQPNRLVAVLASRETVDKLNKKGHRAVVAESDPASLLKQLEPLFPGQGHGVGTLYLHGTVDEVGALRSALQAQKGHWTIERVPFTDLQGFHRELLAHPVGRPLFGSVGKSLYKARTEQLAHLLDEWLLSLSRTGLEEGRSISDGEIEEILKSEWSKLLSQWPAGHFPRRISFRLQALPESYAYRVVSHRGKGEVVVIDPQKVSSKEFLREAVRKALFSIFRRYWREAQDELTVNPEVDLQDIACLADVISRDPPHPWETVLDLGTGRGAVAIALALQGAGLVIGVDHSKLQLKFAQDNVRNYVQEKKVELLGADVASLPLKDQSIDKIYGRALAHQVRDLFLQEVFRVLRPGGMLVLWEHAPSGYPGVWNKEEWERNLAAAGFGDFEVIDYPDWPLYWIRAKKPYSAVGLEEGITRRTLLKGLAAAIFGGAENVVKFAAETPVPPRAPAATPVDPVVLWFSQNPKNLFHLIFQSAVLKRSTSSSPQADGVRFLLLRNHKMYREPAALPPLTIDRILRGGKLPSEERSGRAAPEREIAERIRSIFGEDVFAQELPVDKVSVAIDWLVSLLRQATASLRRHGLALEAEQLERMVQDPLNFEAGEALSETEEALMKRPFRQAGLRKEISRIQSAVEVRPSPREDLLYTHYGLMAGKWGYLLDPPAKGLSILFHQLGLPYVAIVEKTEEGGVLLEGLGIAAGDRQAYADRHLVVLEGRPLEEVRGDAQEKLLRQYDDKLLFYIQEVQHLTDPLTAQIQALLRLNQLEFSSDQAKEASAEAISLLQQL